MKNWASSVILDPDTWPLTATKGLYTCSTTKQFKILARNSIFEKTVQDYSKELKITARNSKQDLKFYFPKYLVCLAHPLGISRRSILFADLKKMEGEHSQKSHESEGVESQDRGLFDFMGKKEEEKPQDSVIVAEFEKVTVSEEPKEEEEEKHDGLLEKLHRSDSSSSSSSDEEDGEDGEKRKKKKKGKKTSEKKEEETDVPIEVVQVEAAPSEEKKGFLEKIKEKLPGQKKAEEVPPPEAVSHEAAEPKKGILEKIKEKLPGYHSKSAEEGNKDKE